MKLITTRVPVQPLAVVSVCECRPEGSPLKLRSVMAGHPVRYIYDCSICGAPHYLEHKDTYIEWVNTKGEVVCKS